jgi:hypothetical protein
MAIQNMSLRSACSTDEAFFYYKVKTSFLGQYSEINVMHFLFSLLRIKGLYRLSITCSSSGGSTQVALGILRACYVS